ncbi:unnamed protein product [Phytomonas sp. EM1]|nr:unnamed protein product [Phytomonas sp. EM1]|eukprot:CCW64442.1 unnamed protein product [Phytomonas sp. isolate EM1]
MFRRLSLVPFISYLHQMCPSCVAQRQTLHHSPTLLAPSDVSKELADDLYKIINNDRIVLFITGTPEEPRCRFTVRLIDLVNQLGLEYVYFNILQDDEVCEGLKKYSDWPTYPQVYIDGELLGGYDVIRQMMLDGSLVKCLNEKKLL